MFDVLRLCSYKAMTYLALNTHVIALMSMIFKKILTWVVENLIVAVKYEFRRIEFNIHSDFLFKQRSMVMHTM